jgi:RHS repeat-associated protein
VWRDLFNSEIRLALESTWQGLMGAAEAAVTQGELYYVHNDHLGTPQVMTDRGGRIVWRATYDPFGMADVDAASTLEMNVRFPGQYYDQEIGLHYNHYRYYEPGTGRYLTSDPIGLRGSLNTYTYVDADPINAIDPLGLVKLHGSWCGPDWTGGYRKSYNELDVVERQVALPPIDALDQCCQVHDVTYSSCRERFPCDAKERSQCFLNADRSLSSCAAGTGSGSRQFILMLIDPANGGSPSRSIEDYMRDSIPAVEENAADCECQRN